MNMVPLTEGTVSMHRHAYKEESFTMVIQEVLYHSLASEVLTYDMISVTLTGCNT